MSEKRSKKLENDWRSDCPVARTLDVIGDRWTLLVIRDIFKGNKRYNEFLDSPEKFPTNILADRLKKLEDEAIIEKKLYNKHPPRSEYLLTNKGLELGKVLEAMYHWGSRNAFGKTITDDNRN